MCRGGGTDRIFVLIVKKSSACDDKDLLPPTRFNPREEEGPCASSPGQTSVPSRRPATPSSVGAVSRGCIYPSVQTYRCVVRRYLIVRCWKLSVTGAAAAMGTLYCILYSGGQSSTVAIIFVFGTITTHWKLFSDRVELLSHRLGS